MKEHLIFNSIYTLSSCITNMVESSSYVGCWVIAFPSTEEMVT